MGRNGPRTDLERTYGIGQNGLRYRCWLRQEDNKFGQQAAKGRQLCGVKLLWAHAYKTRSAYRYKSVTGNAKQPATAMGRSIQQQQQLALGYFIRPIYTAQQIPSRLIIGKELLWQPKGELGAQRYYNRRRINTSLVILSIQPKRTDARIGLSRQGQAIRIGLQSKLGIYVQELELALTTSLI